jgi:tRNA A-37 threonylcarbamoyl transferase component Bud32
MVMVGTEIAKMHLADIIHGDLTTSNMMLRHPSTMGDKQQLVREHYFVDTPLSTQLLGSH